MLSAREEYSRYYGDFRGVDFSSDHTQVLDQRLAYSVNMYKDYQSGKGGGIETIPGYRRVLKLGENLGANKIYAIHTYKTSLGSTRVLIHADDRLYWWSNYPKSVNVDQTISVKVPKAVLEETDDKGEIVRTYEFTIEFTIGAVVTSLYSHTGASIDFKKKYDDDTEGNKRTYTITFQSKKIEKDDFVILHYYEVISIFILYEGMALQESKSFVFNNKLYIIDGENYLCYDGTSVSQAADNAYIPTTYKNIIPTGENADTGLKYEERNKLTGKFKHTFYANGENNVFYMNEPYVSILEVKVYGEVLNGEKYILQNDGSIKLIDVPPAPLDKGYPENYAGVEITAQNINNERRDILQCTISAIFDDRVFLSGNPENPNMIYFCGRSNVTGFTDPTYFPATNFVRDGVGDSGITGLIPVADTLMALKGDTQQDGSVYFHREQATEEDLHPKDYPSSRGLSGIGCLGACINFLDDPVFVSKRGLEGISKLQIASERSIQHRSTLVDAKLVNLGTEALKNAKLEEWNGYLILLVDGKIFMADSRQMYTDEMGVAQYEWYYLEDIGVYNGGWKEYVYDDSLPPELAEVEFVEINGSSYRAAIHPTLNAVANPEGETLDYIDYNKRRFYFRKIDGKAYICKATGAMIGGEFVKATTLKVIDDNLFFGTPNGVICSFNFDMRDENGEIPTRYYNFDGRTIFSGAATKMDSCGIPHLTKSTIKKSTVIKTKAIPSSTVKVKVRTNAKPYEQVARISASRFDFDDLDFADFSFVVLEDTIFPVKEKEKKWVEKQYFVFSDEYCKPLSLFYISYRYNVAGRIK